MAVDWTEDVLEVALLLVLHRRKYFHNILDILESYFREGYLDILRPGCRDEAFDLVSLAER